MAFSFNGLLGLSPKEVPKKLFWSQFALSAQFFRKQEGEILESIQSQALWSEARGQRTAPHNWEERKRRPTTTESPTLTEQASGWWARLNWWSDCRVRVFLTLYRLIRGCRGGAGEAPGPSARRDVADALVCCRCAVSSSISVFSKQTLL